MPFLPYLSLEPELEVVRSDHLVGKWFYRQLTVTFTHGFDFAFVVTFAFFLVVAFPLPFLSNLDRLLRPSQKIDTFEYVDQTELVEVEIMVEWFSCEFQGSFRNSETSGKCGIIAVEEDVAKDVVVLDRIFSVLGLGPTG